MNNKKSILFSGLILTMLAGTSLWAQESAAVGSSDGAENQPIISSVWTQYREARLAGNEPEMADFSFAGYRWGETPIPDVKGKVFNVVEYGAKPNDDRSDKEAVQLAIDAAERNGSGIVFFPPGRFLINEKSDDYNEPIVIRSSHIVLRGSGSGENGTELFIEHHMDPADPKKLWTCPYLIQFLGEKPSANPVPITADSPRESHVVTVKDASAFSVGQWVALNVADITKEGLAEALAPHRADPAWEKIIKRGVLVNEYHYIARVEGNQIFFKEPIHTKVVASRGWTLTPVIPLEEVGVENVALIGNWKERFVHHKNPIHDGGWSVLRLSRCVNSWVRNCRFVDVSRVISAQHCAALTVEDVRIEGNLGHNAVSLGNTTHSLVRNVIDTAGQWHAGGVSGTSSGNVFLRCEYTEHTCYESHASQPRWTLFDNTSGGWMYGRWGGALKSLPNHLEGLVLWNYRNTGKGVPGRFHFMRPDSKHGRIIMPYVIGFHGNPQQWEEDEIKVLESNGAPVFPPSLYEAQYQLRTGVRSE